MTELIETSIADGILTIRIARPEKKNALTSAMYGTMADALEEGMADDGIRVALICGAGDAFTAGNDLKDFLAAPPGGLDRPVWRFLRGISSFGKPLVAAVQGAAVGIGTTMLLHCDLVIAARGARLHLPFVNLGLVPEAASSLLLPRLMGHQRAAAMLMLGEPIDAETALSYGLVSRVVEPEALMQAAREVAGQLAAKPPAALRMTKALMKGDSAAVAAQMAEEGEAFATQLRSAELKEAVAAFFEKRQPNFASAS